MAEIQAEIASHSVGEGMCGVRPHGCPWDGKEVGVRDPQAPLVRVHGPRHGLHRVWITHVYERHGDRYEFVTAEVVPLSAWMLDFRACVAGALRAGHRNGDRDRRRWAMGVVGFWEVEVEWTRSSSLLASSASVLFSPR